MRKIIMFAGVVLLASSAFAQQKSYEGGGIAAGDWIDAGDMANANITEIFVDEHGAIASFDIFSLINFNHTWAGDLIIRLTHQETGTSVDLLHRPDFDGEFGCCGDSSDFGGDYDWQDGGFVYDAVPYGGFVPTDVIMGPVFGSLSDFVGEDKFGTWTLAISDGAAGDLGSLGSWGFTVTNIPAPGALALLGMAGLIGRRKRNRA